MPEFQFPPGDGSYRHVEDDAVQAEFNTIFRADSEAYQQHLGQREGEVQYQFGVRAEMFEAQPVGELEVPATYALWAEKRWVEKSPFQDGYRETIAELKLAEGPAADLDRLRPTALELNSLVEEGQLSIAMQRVEKLAVANGYLDPQRADPRLFTEGPADDFATRRELELDQARSAFEEFEAGYVSAEAEAPGSDASLPTDLPETDGGWLEPDAWLERPEDGPDLDR